MWSWVEETIPGLLIALISLSMYSIFNVKMTGQYRDLRNNGQCYNLISWRFQDPVACNLQQICGRVVEFCGWVPFGLWHITQSSFSRVTVAHTISVNWLCLAVWLKVVWKVQAQQIGKKRQGSLSTWERLAWHFIVHQDKINSTLFFSIKSNSAWELSGYCWVELSTKHMATEN